MMLNVERHGGGGGTPLVIAHGLFGAARNWRAIGRALGGTRPVLAVDMRNHGASPHDPVHDYPAMAADLAAVIRAAGPQADLLGHSMGGKAAMALALAAPDLLRRLVVADIAPVAYAHSHAGLVAAMQDLDLAHLGSRAEADARLAARVPDAAERAFLLQNLVLGPEGPRWQLNLPVLGRAMPDLVGFPDLPGRFAGPALFLHGGASAYVRPEHHAAIRARFPRAEIRAIPEAGHWLHAERPREFLAAVGSFLAG